MFKRRVYIVLRDAENINVKSLAKYLERYIYYKDVIINKIKSEKRLIIKLDNIGNIKEDVYKIIKNIPNVDLSKATLFEKDILIVKEEKKNVIKLQREKKTTI